VGASGAGSVLTGGSGNDFVGTTGNNCTLDGGADNDHLEAAAGHTGDRFLYWANYDKDDITGFATHASGGTDIIDIRGFGVTTFAGLQALMTTVSGNTVITFNGSDVLTVNGVTAGQFQAADFFLA
jgi:hypothetical protein